MEKNPKRPRLATSEPSSTVSPLLASLNKLDHQLANNTDCSSNETRTAFAEVSRSLGEVEGSSGNTSAQIDEVQRKELEKLGGKLWNCSRSIDITTVSVENGERDLQGRKTTAKLRHLALRTIKLAISHTRDTAQTILLLDLTTQTALAYLASNKMKQARELETQAAVLADSLKDLSHVDSSLRSKSASIVLAFLVFRMRLSIAADARPIAEWVRKKADDLMKEEQVSFQQIILIAHAAYEIGTELATKKNGIDDGIGWLEWAKEILKDQPGNSARALELAILKKLLLIHSERTTEKSKNSLEESLKELINVEPTFLRNRKLLELVLARNGSDEEVIHLFAGLVFEGGRSEEQSLSVSSDLYRIPENRRNLRFDITRAIFDKSSQLDMSESRGSTTAVARFLDQLLCVVALHLKSEDLGRMTELLDFIEQSAPNYRISPEPAYLIAIYLQTVAKAVEDQQPEECARWYSLMLRAPLQQLDSGLLAHAARTLAMRYIESKDLERAHEILRACAEEGEDARTDILRSHLAALQDDPLRAVETFTAACSAPNFSTDLLVWVAYQANEAGRREFFSLILVKIVEAAREGKTFEGVDLMIAARLLVRMTMDKVRSSLELPENEIVPPLLSSLEGVLEIARSIAAETSELPTDFAKSLSWIRSSALELCDSFSALWSCASFAKLYHVIASITQVEVANSDVSDELLSNYGRCRLASLAAHAMGVRTLPSQDQAKGYQNILQKVSEFHEELTSGDDPYPRQLAKEDFLKLLKSAILLQAEAHAALDQYDELLKLVELSEDDELGFDEATLSTLRMIADKASTSPKCPYEILRSIYRKTLAILYQNRSLNPVEMAVWLRYVISILLPKEPDEAFKYLQNAQQLVQKHETSYPSEEATWLINTAWDQGIDLYSTSSSSSGSKWCQLSISIAQSTGEEGMANQLEEWFEGLKEQYGDEEEVGNDMQE